MLIAGIDYETNNLNVKTCACVEVGLALWDTERGTPLKINNFLIKDEKAPDWDTHWEVCGQISNIKRTDIMAYGEEVGVVIDYINEYAEDADFMLAANGNKFDQPLQKNFFDRYSISMPTTEWLDLLDWPFPPDCKHKDLLYLAAYHGFINPFPHRALSDVLTMMKIAQQYNIEEIARQRNEPKISFVANVSFAQKELAKEAGFKWEPSRKKWIRVVKADWLDKNETEIASWSFQFDIVDEDITA